jgi:histidinol-phosphate aminotransferase
MGAALTMTDSACAGVPCAVLASAPASYLQLLAQVLGALVEPGASVVLVAHAAASHEAALSAAGVRSIPVPARFQTADLAAMADALAPDTRLVLLGNPDPVTGSFVSGDLLEAFLARMPAGVLVLLDESQNNVLPPALRHDSLRWPARHPGLLLCRQQDGQSVLLGAPALMRRLDGPLQTAVAAAKTDAPALVLKAAALAQLRAGLSALDLHCLPSAADFVLCRVGDAAALLASLPAQPLAVRALVAEGMPQWLRVSVGSATENEAFLAALAVALRGGHV